MAHIIYHESAWKAVCMKYKIQTVNTPASWPVLISFVEDADGTPVTNVVVITPEQAAKFVSAMPPERWQKIDPITRNKIKLSLGINPIKQGQIPATQINMDKYGTTIVTSQDGQTTMTLHGMVGGYKVGDVVMIGGVAMVVTQTNVTMPADDPVTGIAGVLEVGEEAQGSDIPGMEELPIDPSKFEQKDKIADTSDPNEHVLDVERAV